MENLDEDSFNRYWKQGYKEGFREGFRESRMTTLIHLVRTGKLSIEDAAVEVGISETSFRMKMETIC